MIEVKKGAVDQTFYVVMVDSAAGTPETGLTITNMDITYVRERAAHSKTDATALGAVNSAHADNQAIEVDTTQCPGLYRVDFPDAAFASGCDKVILIVTCTGCAPAFIHCRLVNFDSQDTVRLGLTALPNAAADAAGGLPISDAGGLDLDAQRSDVAAILVDTGTTLDGKIDTIDGIVDSILVDTAEIGAAGAGLSAVPWNAAWDAQVESEVTDAMNAYDVPTNLEMLAAFTEIKGATWATTDTLEAIRDRGDAAWVTATGFSTLDAAGVRTAVGLASANLDTQLTELAGLVTTVDTVVDAILVDTGTDGVVLSSAERLAVADAVLARSVATVEASMPEHCLGTVVLAALEWSVSGTTLTVKRTDGSTTHATKTLTSDSGADPITGVS